MRIWASILSFRETEMTHLAYQSLIDQGDAIEFIEVVANGCRSWDEQSLREQIPDATIVVQSENLSFSDSVNGAFTRAVEAGFDAVFFLTNDAELEAGGMRLLQDCLIENPRFAAVMPVQLRYGDSETIHHAGGLFDYRRWSPEIVLGGEPRANLSSATIEPRIWLDGAAVLYRLSAVSKIGGFLPAYGFYWEDVDFGIRANSLGWELAVHYGATANHRVSASSNSFEAWKHYLLARNRLLCARQNLSAADYGPLSRRLLISAIALAIRSPHRLQQRMRLRATLDFMRGRSESPPLPDSFR